MRTITTNARALSLLAALAGCDVTGYYDRDSSLDRWCGESLCDWTTEQGEIARIQTWHAHEYGVELVATDTEISYVGTFILASCMRLSVVADIEPRAQVALDIDVGVDGTLDHTQRLTVLDFERSEFIVPFAGSLSPVKFTIRKEGVGKAKIAEFRVAFDDSCSGTGATYPDGSRCIEDAECTSGACVAELCSECGTRACADGTACKRDAHCGSGACVAGTCDACGAEGSCGAGSGCDRNEQCAGAACLVNFTPASSSSTASAAQCTECTSDDQCEGEFCVFGACAACRDDADCGEGTVCAYPTDTDAVGRACIAPLAEPRPRGALCESAEDCADGLRCGGDDGLAPRCGYACAGASGCGTSDLCWAPERAVFGCSSPECGGGAFFAADRWLLVDKEGELARATTCYSQDEFVQLLFGL